MSNQNNKLNLIFSAIFFIAGGALLLNPGIFPFFFTTASWMITYLFFFLCSVYFGIRYVRKTPVADQKKLFSFYPLTITISLAYLLILVSSVVFIANIIELFRVTL